MEAKAVQVTARDLYDLDFFEWTVRNAELLRAGRFDEADIERVAEELQDMGKREQRELASRLEVLLGHLLKWHVQRGRRSASWKATITVQRSRIKRLVKEMPSLRRALAEELRAIYEDAVLTAVAETRLAESSFPKTCPFTLDQILDTTFFPE